MRLKELTSLIRKHPGWTMRQLAEPFGVTHQAVSAMLKNAEAKGIEHGWLDSRKYGRPCGKVHHQQDSCADCDLLKPRKLTKAERFWGKVKVGTQKECWPWQGTTLPGKYNYGRVSWNGRATYAHRVAALLTYGPPPPGAWVCHRCDTPVCCNPAHVIYCTPREDAVGNPVKGLRPRCKGGRPRQTHCRQGHEFTPDNIYTYTYGDGRNQRQCIKCNKARATARYWGPQHDDILAKMRSRAKARYAQEKERRNEVNEVKAA